MKIIILYVFFLKDFSESRRSSFRAHDTIELLRLYDAPGSSRCFPSPFSAHICFEYKDILLISRAPVPSAVSTSMRVGHHLLLAAVGSLLRHDADPLVPQHPHREHGDAAAVYKLHRLDSQHSGDYIVHVVLAADHRHQTVTRTAHEHQTCKGKLDYRIYKDN